MNLKEKTFRDGTSRRNRKSAELDVNHISIEERSIADLLRFILRFAEQLKYYDKANRPDGNWKLFFGGDTLPGQTRDQTGLTDAEQTYISDMVDYLQDPRKFADDTQKRELYSAPHRVLLLTWLKLLDYARQQFSDLTGRHLDHYYRTVLQLKEKQAVPDRVNLVFGLAGSETEYLLARHTLLDGGQDSSGNPRRYALDDDILLNHAQVARINTLYVQRRIVDLESIHNSDRARDTEAKSDDNFFAMLKWALGYPDQGDDLPRYPRNDAAANDNAVALADLTGIYSAIKGLDYITVLDTRPDDYHYILEQLYFNRLEDFTWVMGLHERQQDSSPAGMPADAEWQQGYEHLENAFLKRSIRTRQDTLRKISESVPDGGFIAMNEYALGAGAGTWLPSFIDNPDAGSEQTLDKVFELLRNFIPGQAEYDNARSYVSRQLHMSTDDFLFIMDAHNTAAEQNTDTWQRVYEIVEQAQRIRENYSPSLKSVQVQRLFPQVLYARDNIALPDYFSPFGEVGQFSSGAEVDAKPHSLGFAVSSPLLLLKEGKRAITLDFTFNHQIDEETSAALVEGLTLEFSGGEEMPWFNARRDDISVTAITGANTKTLNLQITLEESAPAMVAPANDSSAFSPVQPVTSSHPVIRLSVKEIIEDGSAGDNLYYQRLKDLQLQRLRLEVNVGNGIGTGLKDLALRNDDHVLSPDGTLAPFGQEPHRLAGLFVANDEISRKCLENITFHMNWVNLPDSFSSASGHYAGYKDVHGATIEVNDEDFQVDLHVFENRMLGTVASARLFNEETITDADGTHTRLNQVSSLRYEFDPAANHEVNTDLEQTGSADPYDWARYYKLELSGENSTFLQDAYVSTLQNSGEGQSVNQPYTPQIRQITIDYSCAGTVDFTARELSAAPVQVLQIHPFGQVDLVNTDALTNEYGNQVGYHLLPQYDDSGYLYIGVEGLKDKQELSLLFQVAPGTENTESGPSRAEWHYLSDDSWNEFREDEILSDTTDGLLDTGIIRYHPPSSLNGTAIHPPATASSHLLPSGFHWFGARVPENSHAFPKLITVLSQAASATRLMQPPDAEFTGEPAPAQAVTKPVTPIAAIDSVTQPFSSLGGKGREDNEQFIKRISERLRHKGRALSTWDYERLVLERFPEIYRVKCLAQSAQDNDPAEAKVRLVVVPDLVNRTPFFPLQPKVSHKLRRRIADYLQDRISPFVKFEVVNARYEEVRYRVTPAFREKENEGLYIRRLNQDIINYLSPWAYDSEAELTFGGSIHRSSLIRFITNLPYVDFIGSLELVDHSLIGQDNDGTVTRQLLTPLAQDFVETRFPDSILVSSPNHYIDLVTDQFEAFQFSGIGYMAVDADFVVT